MNMSRQMLATAFLLLAVPLVANAEDTPPAPISWEVSAVSDYLFRGVSQTNGKPTLQANLTWTTPMGLYVGSTVSGVDFGSGSPHAEVDYTVGYGHTLSDAVALDVSLSRYTYSGASMLNYNELITTATFAEHYTATVGYSSNIWNSSSTGWYYAVGGQWGLPKDFSLSANVGRNLYRDNLAVGVEDYTDWNVGVSKAFGITEVALGYYGTDGTGRTNFGKLANSRLMLSVKISH